MMLSAGLRDAIAVTNPSEARTQGKESPAGLSHVYVEQSRELLGMPHRHHHQRSTCKMLYFGWLLMERAKATEAHRRYWKINSSLFAMRSLSL